VCSKDGRKGSFAIIAKETGDLAPEQDGRCHNPSLGSRWFRLSSVVVGKALSPLLGESSWNVESNHLMVDIHALNVSQ
jgi:hypothetical protein